MQDRAHFRALRKKLSAEMVSSASQKIAEQIIALPEYIASKHIAYYVSHENEIDPEFIIKRARELKKRLYLPIFSDNHILFYGVNKKTQFQKNKWGIMEPIVHDKPISPEQLDLILVPVVVFDSCCHRIGRGAGCYDRALQDTQHPVLIGLAYEFQRVGRIVPEKWDVPMNCVITEKHTYYQKPIR